MKNKNHNIRFNMEKEAEKRAWERLHSEEVRHSFKSQNRFVIEAINDYYERHLLKVDDPYLETREKEDAFADRIVRQVEGKVLSNLPALVGVYVAQIQSLSVQANGFAVVGEGRECAGDLPNELPVNEVRGSQSEYAERREEEPDQLPDNDLLDFDAF